jgi:hypothetical protein
MAILDIDPIYDMRASPDFPKNRSRSWWSGAVDSISSPYCAARSADAMSGIARVMKGSVVRSMRVVQGRDSNRMRSSNEARVRPVLGMTRQLHEKATSNDRLEKMFALRGLSQLWRR